MPIHLFDFSDEEFKHIISQPQFALPIRWDGRDFESTLKQLFESYCNALFPKVIELWGNKSDPMDRLRSIDPLNSIDSICSRLQACVKQYHLGFPAEAFFLFQSIMNDLINVPLNIDEPSTRDVLSLGYNLDLFRVRLAKDTATHKRKEMFHVPASLRSLVSTCRYSIAGHPSLYLTDSIELGIAELHGDDNTLISRYRLADPKEEINRIGILDLGIKPQDFWEETNESNWRLRSVRQNTHLDDSTVQSRYLLWYPLIAACSFIRAYKSRPFAPEYIIPQLLMQWLRGHSDNNALMGIRYFSCASMRASNLGFNYVFPTYDTAYQDEYCSVLQSNFQLTEPVYYKDFSSPRECKTFLTKQCKAEKI